MEELKFPLHIILSNVIVGILGLLYMIRAIGVFKRYSKKIRYTFSTIDKINLKCTCVSENWKYMYYNLPIEDGSNWKFVLKAY